jgi:eukaryotic-like serine/threonine-protein kinase
MSCRGQSFPLKFFGEYRYILNKMGQYDPRAGKMRIASFLIPVVSCLLVLCLAVLPAMALPGGNTSTVTISASPSPDGSWYIGDTIRFSGTNTGSNTTYLYLTGPGLSLGGTLPDSNDMVLVPVTRGVVSSYKTVSVGGGHQWSWDWDTHKTPLIPGTYTVWAISTRPILENPGDAIHDSVNISIREPALSVKARPLLPKQGDTITISGNVTGHPGSGIAIWVIGPEYSGRSVVEPDDKGSYSLDIDSTTIHLVPGTYHVFAEHPSVDDSFDFDLNGDYLFNNYIRSNIFTFRGNGRLYGEAAYTAFSAALNGPKNDDLIVPVMFSFGVPPPAIPGTTAGSPLFNGSAVTGSTAAASGTSTTPDPAPGQVVAGSPLPRTPEDTVTEGAGNSSGPIPSPAGKDGGDLPYGTLAGVFFLILLGGIGGAAFLSARKKRRGGGGNGTGNTLILPQRDDGPESGAGTGTPGHGPALPETLTVPSPASPAVPMNAFPRELAGKYSKISPIGSGGFAMVYSAYRTSDGRKVAVKIPISSSERTGKSFLHEIKVWETLHHPNIVEVLATNILPVPYVEMEYVAGSLERLAKPIDPVTAARIVRGITEGIRYAHRRRCIHRDIKPQNILLSEEMIPKITDWGISKVLEDPHKKTTVAGFSLAYAAPEQIAPEKFGGTDERTDIYQIGAVFYELVTGLTLFNDESMMEMVSQITREDPLLISDINPDALAVEKIIIRCLAKNKNQRYQSAGELLDALTGYLDTVAWGLFEDDP